MFYKIQVATIMSINIVFWGSTRKSTFNVLHNNAIWYEQILNSAGLVTLLWWTYSNILLITHASAKHRRPSLKGSPPPGVLAEGEAGSEPEGLCRGCFTRARIFFVGDYYLSKIALKPQVEKVSYQPLPESTCRISCQPWGHQSCWGPRHHRLASPSW